MSGAIVKASRKKPTISHLRSWKSFGCSIPRKKNWEDFHGLVKSRFGESDPFYKVAEITTPFLRLIRDARDCFEHANLEAVETRDFELQPDGTVADPSIEINFRKSA
jgi:hypothetical protein